ncbi:Plug domain-containing protein [Acinetobacter sp. YH12157]|uniref:Plug domain-containing protein n=1 Tax=Acinetobacter sp. YH12157 TaxID=2601137 RepID=UPI00211F18A1|nr:Plug domain-containing protein [Acinetobacter sp. YH12157]
MRFAYSSLSVAILSSFSSLSFAEQIQESEHTAPSPSLKLSTIVVEAKDENTLGKTVYNQEDLKKSPNSSKNITDFLKVNPNVQLGHRFRSSLQQGELNAADISINGGLAYDNKILINGLSINNTINPVGAQQSNHPNQLMGNSQTAAINTDLLCKLTVLDSNVGAEYGEFTGGVVSAETYAPQTEIGKIHGSLSYDYTSDAWSKVNFPSQDSRDTFEDSSDESAQPYFTKQGISLNSYGRLSEQWGFNAFASYRHSAIPLKTDFAESGQFEQQRQARNAGVELFYPFSHKTSPFRAGI